jgi:hypothetical protein
MGEIFKKMEIKHVKVFCPHCNRQLMMIADREGGYLIDLEEENE